MPDKQDNWLPDQQFWAEAWADMDRRLEHEDRRRRRRFVLLALLLLLLGGTVAFGWWTSRKPVPSPETESVVAHSGEARLPASDRPAPSDGLASVPDSRSGFLAEEGINRPSPGPLNGQLSEPGLPGGSRAERLNRNRPFREPESNPTNAEEMPPLREELPPAEVQLLPIAHRTQLIALLPIATPDPVVSTALPDEAANPIDLRLSPRPIRLGVRKLSLSAYALLSHGSRAPGNGAGMGLTLSRSVGDKWAIWTEAGLRLEKTSLRLSTLSDTSILTLVADEFAPSRLNAELRNQNLDRLRAFSTVVDVGVSRRVGDNLQLWMAGGIQYLMHANGPLISAENAFGVQVDIQDIYLNQNRDFSISTVGDNSGLSSRQYAKPWQARLSAGAKYRIGQKMDLGVGLLYRPTNVFESGVWELDRWRGELRFSYRF